MTSADAADGAGPGGRPPGTPRKSPARREHACGAPRLASDLARAAALAGRPALRAAGPLRTGVDLGTASCVLVVLDGSGEPVWVDSQPSAALRDGVVVDSRPLSG